MTSRTEERRSARSAPGHLERHLRLVQRPLGTHDALGDRRLGGKEGARDLAGGEAADQAQRQRQAGVGRQDRMAGREDQAEEIVADVVVKRTIDLGDDVGPVALDVVAELGILALAELPSPELVDRPVARRRHQPGAGIAGNPALRPLLEGDDEGVLRQFLGEADVTNDPGEARDELRLLDAPDRVDGAMDVGGRHGRRYTTNAGKAQA